MIFIYHAFSPLLNTGFLNFPTHNSSIGLARELIYFFQLGQSYISRKIQNTPVAAHEKDNFLLMDERE